MKILTFGNAQPQPSYKAQMTLDFREIGQKIAPNATPIELDAYVRASQEQLNTTQAAFKDAFTKSGGNIASATPQVLQVAASAPSVLLKLLASTPAGQSFMAKANAHQQEQRALTSKL